MDDATKANMLAEKFAEAHRAFNRQGNRFEDHDKRISEEAEVVKSSLLSHDAVPLITHNELYGHLKQLRPNKAPGDSGLLNKVLKNINYPTRMKLLTIYNACLTNSYWPSK